MSVMVLVLFFRLRKDSMTFNGTALLLFNNDKYRYQMVEGNLGVLSMH